ncbi:CSN8/PSMD8/EIF3K family protein [Aspergillus glaucus CBS 516.65]|uniref:CSN8/PSMD8/EIF3K domain-containing protein n=1 Tax=Aspergillus glaucus CBS 516.65 TaxID=1160497 RepID=A0A1L9VYA0_ASPGL|nr:hypothetical protein ASPGLDRAFT_79282 [Aspergillus glaucus CBS 516.65]OJJ88859.1 hypothetical protein ASPGLDRAFT_79282 [Aspergillus glaucus CBS 516.65]
MDLPPLSQEQLSLILSSAATPSKLYDTLSQYEGQVLLLADSNGDPELLSLFYSFFLFSHLLIEELSEARMLTKRIPQNLVANNSLLQNCTILLRAVWQKSHDHIYRYLRGLPWPEPLQPLVQRYEAYFQNKTLEELSYTYEAIRPETAASYLGLDSVAAQQGNSDIIQKFTDCGWKWDGEAKLLHPKPIALAHGPDDRQVKGLREVMALLGKS